MYKNGARPEGRAPFSFDLTPTPIVALFCRVKVIAAIILSRYFYVGIKENRVKRREAAIGVGV
jgi:hypothetical protein